MSNINDVLFVNVDGMADYFINNNQTGLKRIEKVKKIKSKLLEQGLRAVLLNPQDDADIKIPIFVLNRETEEFEETEIDYSFFILKNLYDYIKHLSFSHIIIFQYDGYPINFDEWKDDFLNYEYLGHISYMLKDSETDIRYNERFSLEKNKEGFHINGGFSLRSRDFLKKCKEIPVENFKKLYEKKQCTNEDLLLLDFLDLKKMPEKKEVFEKFVDNKIETNSFGFHKNKPIEDE